MCLALYPAIGFSQDKALYLNPDNATGAKASVLFSGAELIPLETTKASHYQYPGFFGNGFAFLTFLIPATGFSSSLYFLRALRGFVQEKRKIHFAKSHKYTKKFYAD